VKIRRCPSIAEVYRILPPCSSTLDRSNRHEIPPAQRPLTCLGFFGNCYRAGSATFGISAELRSEYRPDTSNSSGAALLFLKRHTDLRMDPMTIKNPLFLGCPVWACDHWRGSLYTSKAPRADWLKQYSSVFGTVEGNSTFYALPSLETAQRWADSVVRGFQFSLKVPRVISHDKRLRDAEKELKAFVEVADILDVARCLGPSFLQLPPDFSPESRSVLEKFLRELPTYLPWALEVRHFDWYDAGPVERWLDKLLTELRIDKVLFDSRPLYSKPPADEIEKASQSRKPKTPIRHTVTGEHPFLRIVGRNNLDDVTPWIDEWAPIIAGWIVKGLTPFVFTHAPDDKFAPEFARRMHAAVKKLLPSLPEMPAWPGEAAVQDARKQRTLF